MKEECMKVRTIRLQIMCEQEWRKIICSFFAQKLVASYLINCYYGKKKRWSLNKKGETWNIRKS